MTRFAAVSLVLLGCSGGGGQSLPDDAPGIADGTDVQDPAPDAAADSPDVLAANDPGPEPSHPPFVITANEGRTAGKASGHAFVTVSNWGGEADETGIPVATVGDCTFHEPRPMPFCDPPCPVGKVCRTGDVCGEPSGYLDAGVVTVTGLKAGLTLTPQSPYPYYQATWDPADPGADLFDEGAPLTAQAAGKTVPAFTVQARGVAPMDSPLPCKLPLKAGTSFEVTWTPAVQGDRVEFRMVSGNHAAQFTGLACTTTDTGKLIVDASLIAKYLEDWRPMERWDLVRYSEGRVVTEGGYPIVFRASGAIGCMYSF